MIEAGVVPPASLTPPPQGTDPRFEDWLIHAFYDLSTCRDVGMGVGPIPWRDIVAYADRAGWHGLAGEVFVTIMRSLDVAYLNDESARVKAEDARREAEQKGGRRG